MKKVFLGSFITILSVSLILAGIYYYKKLKMQRTEVVDAIPADAALIIQGKNLDNALRKLRKSSFWQNILSHSTVKQADKKLHVLDSLVGSYADFKNLLKDQLATVSLHTVKMHDADMLFLLSVPDLSPESYVNNLVNSILKDRIPIAKRIYDGITIIQIPLELNGKREEFTYTVLNGLFVGSFSSVLLESSIREIRKNKQNTLDESFKKVMDAAGSSVDANVYVNYRYFSSVFARYLSPDNSQVSQDVADFASWTELDVKFREEALSLSGLTSARENTFLSCMEGQEPQQVKITGVLPYTTAFMMYWGLSDFRRYYDSYHRMLEKAPVGSIRYKSRVQREALGRFVQDTYTLPLEEKMLSWIGNEMALVTLEPTDSTFEDNTFAVFATRNPDEAMRSLEELRSRSSQDTLIVHNDHKIGCINIDGLIPGLFGRAFLKIKGSCYTAIGNYIVFGNKVSALRSYIDENIAQRVLSREQNYQKLAVSIASRASFYLYANVPRVLDVVQEHASDSLVRSINNDGAYYTRFNAIALQYVGDSQLSGFFTNLYIQNAGEDEAQTDVEEEWALPLDSTLSMEPRFVVNHLTGDKEIIVQDDGNKLYLVNKEGAILWSRQLPGKIMGTIHQVDAFRNNRYQYMFNTKLGLHLLDRNGETVEGFPVRFPVPVTCPVAVFDYDSTGDYRVFAGGTNGMIYAYKADGKPLEGWTFTKPIWPVHHPVQHVRVEGQDYLFISDSKGITYIVDRKGEKKAIADKPVYRSANGRWILDVVDQPYVITTDTTGNIYNLYFDGHTEVEHIADYQPSHSFDFRDINGDQLRDYIFLDRNYLFVCNQDTSRIFDYTLPGRSGYLMRNFQLNDGMPVIGVVSTKDSQLFLFDKEGTIKKGFPVKGSTLFNVDYLSRPLSSKVNPRQYLIVGDSRNLRMYSVR
jgi:hypothetical protein